MKLLTTRIMGQIPQWCSSFDEPEHPDEVCMQRRLSDGRLLMVMPRTRGVTLAIGMPAPYHRIGVFADAWGYSQDMLAYYAFHSWDPMKEKEPTGWTSHQATGRYRLHGDPHLEYIQMDGTLEEQILHALNVSTTHDQHILEVEEIAILRQDTFFLPGTRCFLAYLDSDRCPHTPTCRIPYTLFVYAGRCVVLDKWDIAFFEQEPLIYRLTSQDLAI